jgi:hypothetical protein
VRPALVVALVVAVVAAACDSDEPRESARQDPQAREVRDWLEDLNRGDYAEAAKHFAPNALVDQGIPFRLKTPKAARLFNATLPCQAEVVEVKHEGERLLVSFRLRTGPGGPCEGVVKVRFSFEGMRFSEFLQLPGEGDEEPLPGESV